MLRRQLRDYLPIFVTLLLAAGSAWIAVPGCGDSSPTAPRLLPSLADADSAYVNLHVLGAIRYMGDNISLDWMNIGTQLKNCVYEEDTAIFQGEQVIMTDVTMNTDSIHLRFDPRSGEIDSLFCRSSYSYPRGGRSESLTAHAIPLSSYDVVDGRMEAVWRIDGVLTCAAVDTATYNSSGGSASMLTWSCAGAEEPFIEIRLTN